MKKITISLLFSLSCILTIHAQLEISTEEVKSIYLGMKKSDVEKFLLRKASKTGLSFNFEDYRIQDIVDIDSPSDLSTLNKKRTKGYILENSHFLFVNDSLRLISIWVSDPENLNNLFPTLISRYGEKLFSERYAFLMAANEDIYILKRNSFRAISRSIIDAESWEDLQNEIERSQKRQKEKEISDIDNDTEEISIADIYGEDDSDIEDVDNLNENTPFLNSHLSIDIMNKIRLGSTKNEISNILDTSLDDWKVDIKRDFSSYNDEDDAEIYRYNLAEFIFIKDKLANASYCLNIDIDEYKTLYDTLVEKYGYPHSTQNLTEHQWADISDGYTISYYNALRKYPVVTIEDPKFFKSAYRDSITRLRGEKIYPISISDVINIKLLDSKQDVNKALQKTTHKPDFDISKNLLLNKEKHIIFDSEKDSLLDYEMFAWNDLTLIFSEDKLVNLTYRLPVDENKNKDAISKEISKAQKMQIQSVDNGNLYIANNDNILVCLSNTYNDSSDILYHLIWKPWLPADERKKLEDEINRIMKLEAE